MEKETELFLVERIKELEKELKEKTEFNRSLILKNCKLKVRNADIEATNKGLAEEYDEFIDFIISKAKMTRIGESSLFLLHSSFSEDELPSFLVKEFESREEKKNEPISENSH